MMQSILAEMDIDVWVQHEAVPQNVDVPGLDVLVSSPQANAVIVVSQAAANQWEEVLPLLQAILQFLHIDWEMCTCVALSSNKGGKKLTEILSNPQPRIMLMFCREMSTAFVGDLPPSVSTVVTEDLAQVLLQPILKRQVLADVITLSV